MISMILIIFFLSDGEHIKVSVGYLSHMQNNQVCVKLSSVKL